MNPLHEQFVGEARELIQQATDDLIALERDGVATAGIDRILRAFHTLKGSAGLVDLPAMSVSMHAAEDLVAAVQAGRVPASGAVITSALQCLDQVSQWIDGFEAHSGLPARAGEEARDMADALRRHLRREADDAPAASAGAGLPDAVTRLMAVSREAIGRRLATRPTPLFAVCYEPRADCFLDGDDPLRLVRQIPDLLALHVELRGEQPPLDELDPFECRLRLTALAGEPRDGLAAVFRLVPDQVRIFDIPPQDWRATPAPDGDLAKALSRAIVGEQRHVLRAGDGGDDFFGRVSAGVRTAGNALRHARCERLADAIARAGSDALARRDVAPLLAALEAAFDAMASVPQPGGAGAPGVVAPPASDAAGVTSRWLRVEQSRVDALVNLAGELVALAHRFAHLTARVESGLGGNELSRAMKREQDSIGRLGGEMHNAILQLRMVPVAQILRAVPRLVRDLSRRFDKQVQLVTRGEGTQSDKAVVDRLFEPILHLVRNAVDHGIEAPDQRRDAGKSETATLTIAASRLGDRIIVEVGDDGRGIDPAVIRRKARERALMDGEALSALSDEQVLELIFAAGFSTAAQVSDISGRGVGMDVVRAAVEGIGGRVSLTSAVGAGTTVRLDLPVSIATARIMVVECGGQRFGIPMDAVTETVRVPSERVRQVKSNEGFVLRDRIVPICSLAELMHLQGTRGGVADARLMVVVEAGGRSAGIEIDAICDRIDVILKPMPGLLSKARGYAGTTLLGDGTVLLVLDIKELLS